MPGVRTIQTLRLNQCTFAAPSILNFPPRVGSRISSADSLRRARHIAHRSPTKALYTSAYQGFCFSQTTPNLSPIVGTRHFSHSTSYQASRPREQLRSHSFQQSLIESRPFTDKPNSTVLKCGAGSWTTVFLIGLAAGAVFLVIPTKSEDRRHTGAIVHKRLEELRSNASEDFSKMTGEAQPGRPGTLTPEQEEKLREFWIAVLQVFDVLDKEHGSNGNADPAPGTPRSETSLSTKKPKKKRGLFRKKDASDTASTTSEPDDKYGQTKEYHEALASQSPDSLRATFWSMVKHDHPDALLLRFLRARKWDVTKALVMLVSTMKWRASEMHVDDDIMKNGELGYLEFSKGSDPAKKKLGEDFLTQMRMGKSFLHGLDVDERPMCFVRARLHKQGDQSEESLEKYTVFVIESARMILAPPVDTACVVFDLTGFSLANMDYAPVKFMIKCFEANYPESLGVVLVHKAPWVFQGIWKIIKGWLDPVVASKIHFTNNNSEMEAFVPKSRIIHELSGEEDWEYKYIEPVPGENDKMKDTETRDKLLVQREKIVEEYEQLTIDWIHAEGDAEALKKKRHEVAGQLRDDYWALDPYIRARSYYDRVGLINPGGKLEFYKGEPVVETVPVAASAPAATNGTKTVETSADDID